MSQSAALCPQMSRMVSARIAMPLQVRWRTGARDSHCQKQGMGLNGLGPGIMLDHRWESDLMEEATFRKRRAERFVSRLARILEVRMGTVARSSRCSLAKCPPRHLVTGISLRDTRGSSTHTACDQKKRPWGLQTRPDPGPSLAPVLEFPIGQLPLARPSQGCRHWPFINQMQPTPCQSLPCAGTPISVQISSVHPTAPFIHVRPPSLLSGGRDPSQTSRGSPCTHM